MWNKFKSLSKTLKKNISIHKLFNEEALDIHSNTIYPKEETKENLIPRQDNALKLMPVPTDLTEKTIYDEFYQKVFVKQQVSIPKL